ncbi:potassium-transporting ATPase subunit KdpA [Terribacillus sp. DMT04]|uniref:potassium-transporting ATPase subunit KdpA n=1 Tax=Terribacillus sp. DMT04 TaxID=2850441 RepID=UPI001C2BC37F|nr:potassium-transporting ATPase subunit KdpA [Terribacillus sp. DMT04]QXE03505.1 potassium-transporting ATPase subunit KdpA [Terribacillus sp. DMT04]
MVSLLVLAVILILIGCTLKPMGLYMAAAFSDSRMDRIFLPVENFLYRLAGLRKEQQNWKQFLTAMLLLNFVILLFVYAIFRFQGVLPLNPLHIAGMDPALAFNTAVSFMTNTDLQHYSGESGLSLFSQTAAVLFMMFIAPATALSSAIGFIRLLGGKPIGNFYETFLRSLTRLFVPLAFVMAVIFIALGVPQTFSAVVHATGLNGAEQTILRGPVSSFLVIKELGNNGGGFFGVNSAHPFENPNAYTNMLQYWLMLLLPASLPFTYGKMINKPKQGAMLFWAMTVVFFIMGIASLITEIQVNPLIQQAVMEGKETRFGVIGSVMYAVITTATETGAVNTMHDTLSPITGMLALGNMLLNTVFGGVGAGFMNVMLYVMIAVFLAGLMVGRTPALLGKKLEGKEMKLLAAALLIQPVLILIGTALAIYLPAGNGAISNPGYHGLTQVLYEITSSAANNGSGFEGLGDATVFWNILTGVVMFLGRYLSIILLLAVAASLAGKPAVRESIGSLRTDQPLFASLLVGTFFLVGALTFLPVLVLGPIAEYVTL